MSGEHRAVQFCKQAACVNESYVYANGPDGVSCLLGPNICCSGEWINPVTHVNHCGSCGEARAPRADSCVNGQCVCGAGPRCLKVRPARVGNANVQMVRPSASTSAGWALVAPSGRGVWLTRIAAITAVIQTRHPPKTETTAAKTWGAAVVATMNAALAPASRISAPE